MRWKCAFFSYSSLDDPVTRLAGEPVWIEGNSTSRGYGLTVTTTTPTNRYAIQTLYHVINLEEC